jgi:hypothetical protein
MTPIASCAVLIWQPLQRRGGADCRHVLAGAHENVYLHTLRSFRVCHMYVDVSFVCYRATVSEIVLHP